MRRSGYLFRQLIALAGVACLPLLLLLAYNIHTTAEDAREQALSAVDNQAIAVARDVETLLQSTQQYLTFVAAQPLVRQLDPARCDPIIAGVTQRRAHFADMLGLDPAGKAVCASVRRPGTPRAGETDLHWLPEALASKKHILSKPYLAPIAKRQVIAMALAMRAPGGEAIGVVAVLLDLESLQRTWHRQRLPPGARLSVVSDDGTMITSAPDFERWVGKNVKAVVDKAMRDNPSGTGLAFGVDGVERAFARAPISDWGLAAFAAFPTSVVFAHYEAERRRSLVVATLAVAVAAGLALLLARRLAHPLRDLAATARAVGNGAFVRADTSAPGEFCTVAKAFNAMLDGLERSQAALQASQRQYAELFAGIQMLSFMTDHEDRITKVNDFMLAAFGWSREELVGQHASRLFPEGEEATASARREALAGGHSSTATEGPIVTRTGERRVVRWHHSLLRDEENRVTGLASLGEDVTEARESEVRERRQSDLYAALSRTNSALLRVEDEQEMLSEICRICVEHGHASIAYISLVQGAVAHPTAWAGAAQDFLVGRDLSLDPSLPEGRGITASAINTGRPFIVDDAETHPATLPWRALGRSIGTRSLAAFPFRRAGQVAGALTLHMTSTGFFNEQVNALLEEMAADLSFALDHYDRVEALRLTQQRLHEREQQLTGLVETAMDAFITVDVSQRIRLFNQAAAAMFGVPAQDVLGEPLDRFIPQRLREAHQGHVARFATTGSTARRMGLIHALVGLRGNGEEFPIEASISKFGLGEGALMTVVVRDATEMRRAEEARLARAAAESANRAKSEFLSRMSHELRTPLNAIIGFSQLLQAGDGDSLRPSQLEQVEYIRQAGWHLLALVSDVLDVSRIDAGRMLVEARELDAQGSLDEAVRLTLGLAAQRQVALGLAAGLPRPALGVRADPVRLRQVLLNVLSNAVKYNRAGGHVEVGVRPDGEFVCFSIVDTGLGMTPQQLQHLYEPFNRLGREGGGIEGTGLGLALTRQLLALMGGDMVVRSEVDHGTQVEIRLPGCTAPGTGRADQAANADQARSTEPAGTVLYIEDNAVNRLLVEQMLACWPRVLLLQEEDGRSGIERAQAALPEIVLLDMRLPDMTGLQVLQALRGDPRTAGLRVAVLSGNAMPDEVEAARRAGADAYWTKPLDFRQFLADIAHWLHPTPPPP